jgi:hypothetical protein
VRHLLLPVERAHLVERADGGGEAPVHREDAPVDERAEREVVKGVGGGAPDGGGAVLADALVVEAVDLFGGVGGGWVGWVVFGWVLGF